MIRLLIQIENTLQNLIEGGSARLFSSEKMQDSLVEKLAKAMNDGIQTREDGKLIAPNYYLIHINPIQAEFIRSNSVVINELSRYLYQAGGDADLEFQNEPVIRIVEDQTLDRQDVVVVALDGQTKISDTLDYTVEDDDQKNEIPAGAFLIVNGMQIYPLHEKLVNIGRRFDNQLVIEDPRVSRLHAQLRVVEGRYMIFDLNSRGGTFINGNRVEKSYLRPGDVISLSGVPLVYSQESLDAGDTQKIDLTPVDH